MLTQHTVVFLSRHSACFETLNHTEYSFNFTLSMLILHLSLSRPSLENKDTAQDTNMVWFVYDFQHRAIQFRLNYFTIVHGLCLIFMLCQAKINDHPLLELYRFPRKYNHFALLYPAYLYLDFATNTP